MEDKTPIYSVLDGSSSYSSGTPERRCLSWTSLFLSGLGVLTAAVALLLATQQAVRLGDQETRLLQGEDRLNLLEARLDTLSEFKDFLDYFQEDYNDEGLEDGEEAGYYSDDDFTAQRVLGRRKRDIPVVARAYGVDFSKARPLADKLRLYEDLAQSSELKWQATEDPIQPHHRVSSTWSRREDEEARRENTYHKNNSAKKNSAKKNHMERPSRVKKFPFELVKSLDGYQHDSQDMPLPESLSQDAESVLYRESFVKNTDSSSSPGPNSVFLPPLPQVVEQTPLRKKSAAETTIGSKNINTRSRSVSASSSFNTLNKRRRGMKRPNKKNTRRARRTALTVAHYVASNNTADDGPIHKGWSSAPWMDKLGLNRKYQLRLGTVTVKEPGLYYIYAQMLYENSRFGTGFQIIVDGIPVLQCTLAPAQPSNSCHTGGATYLPRNAEVVIRDLENYMTPVVREENTFFGLIKLLDAPASAESLVLG